MWNVGKISVDKAVLLAPMEDVTDISFRLVCRELGADVVYTEFVNSEGLIRSNEKTHKKLRIVREERPVGIQIYGGNIKSMIGAAKIAEAENPDLIDINAGCWIKGVVACGAGAGLLKDPAYMAELVKNVVDNVSIPVTVKTRLGMDGSTITILDVVRRLEDAGAKALTIHCRTRVQGHSGIADWSWIPKIKEVISIPVALNGSIFTAEDVKKAFEDTNADAIMIARGAIGNPWIFKESKEILSKGIVETIIDEELRIKTTLRHLKLAVEVKGEKRAVLEHRKFYTGYLKGLHNASHIRKELMSISEYIPVEDLLLNYLQELLNYRCVV
jgi:tRNA-dihydrouridine synthase B